MAVAPLHPWFRNAPAQYVVGHRGAAAHAPENTVPSFRKALELGADALELDIHLTRDKHLVVTHDEQVDRISNNRGLVAHYTLDALQALDAGYQFTPDQGRTFPWRGKGVPIPTLAEVVDACPNTPLVIEIKPDRIAVAKALADFLQKHDRRQTVLVCSFHDRNLQAFRQYAPDYATGAGPSETKRFVLAAYAGRAAPAALSYNALTVPRTQYGLPIVTRRTVRRARDGGLHIQVWTINDPRHMQQLYRLGVQAVTTDYPDRARAVLDERA